MKNENTPNKTENPETTPTPTQPESLDSLLEVLDGDDLRHILGGGRVKYPPFSAV